MNNPLPTAEPAPTPQTAVDGTPWSEYVRVIEFLDRNPAGPNDAPVHVLTAPVLFDGVMADARIAKGGVTIDLGEGGTVVTLHVYAEDVQIGTTSDADPYVPHMIGGRRVLTPTGEGWEWVPVDEEVPDLIVCSIYVAEVHVR